MARIRETIEMLDKREALCQKRIEMEVQKAKQFVQQKKKTSTFDAPADRLCGADHTGAHANWGIHSTRSALSRRAAGAQD